MKTVEYVLNTKGRQVWTIGPEASVFEALQLMAEKDVGALPVVEGGRVVGMISERDYARKVILIGRSSKETAVRRIMSHHVVWAEPGFSVDQCMALMTARRVRHLPILEDGRLVGLVSMRDLVNTVITEQGDVIRQLENHILEAAGLH
jgi:CBS domain-containing protein